MTVGRSRTIVLCLYLVVVLLGLGLRLYQANQVFDGDEIFSVETAGSSLSHLFEASVWDRVHPPIYYGTLYVWIKLFGSSETTVRALSVFFSGLFLWALSNVAMRLTGRLGGLFVLAVCALSPFFVFYGQQARSYALVTLLASLTVLLLLKAREEPSRLRWPVLYGVTCAALINTEYLSALLLMVEFAYLLAARSPETRRSLFAGIAGALTIIPWILLLVTQSVHREMGQSFAWNPRPTVTAIAFYVVEIFGWLETSGLTRGLLLVVALSLLPLALRWRDVNWSTMSLPAALATVPPIALFLVATYAPGSLWATRQLIGSAVFLVLIIGYGLTLYRRRWLGFALGLALVIWCMLGVRSAPTGIPWRELVSSLERDCAGCLIAGQEGMLVVPLRYYSNREVVDVRTGLRYSNAGSLYPYDVSSGTGALNMEGTDRIVFVCREPRCANLDRLTTGHYRVVASRTIDWSKYDGQPVKVFELARTD
jgi:hypothetical protein